MPEGVALHHLELLDQRAVAGLVAETRPDVIHHLAAQSSVAASWKDPMRTLFENAVAQYNVLEAMLSSAPDARMVVVGSCDEYGNVAREDNPVHERQELRPSSPYALSKVTQDLMGRQYAELHGLAVVRLRPFLQIGPRRPDRFAAGSFARQVAEIERGLREPVIEVGNIDLQRDFTDVRDVARAYALIAERGQRGEVYNIASGTAHSLRDLLEVMLQTARVEAEIRVMPALKRTGEAALLIGDADRLRTATGWETRVSFEQSAADTLAYWQRRIQRMPAQGRSTR